MKISFQVEFVPRFTKIIYGGFYVKSMWLAVAVAVAAYIKCAAFTTICL